jgi:hypothetical protein
VEAVFGQLKSNNKFNRFKGSEKVILEASLMAIGHNLRKMATKDWKILLFYLFYFKILFFTKLPTIAYQKYSQ